MRVLGAMTLGMDVRDLSVQGGAGHCCAGFAEGTFELATNPMNNIKSRSCKLGLWTAHLLPVHLGEPGSISTTSCCQLRGSPACKQQENLAVSLQGVSM